jgi:hypothetical protein
VRGVAEDDTDTPVAESQYVSRDRMAGCNFVHRDDHAPVEVAVRRYPGIGKLLAIEHVEQFWLVASRRGKQDAIQPRTEKKLAEFGGSVRDLAERKYHEPVAPVLETGEGAVLQFDDIAGARPFIGQADQEAASGDKALCGEVRVIVERFRGFLDLPAYRFADMGSVIERTRDGLGSDPGYSGDIDDRGSF